MKLETAFVPSLSVVIITLNEAHNLPRTLESVKWADEIIVVDSGSTDGTQDIARSFGAKVYEEPWKGFAAQKNSAIEKATCDWILSLDADEEVSPEVAREIQNFLQGSEGIVYLRANQKESFRWWKGDPGQENWNPEGKVHWVLTPDLYARTEDETFNLVGVKIPRQNFFLGRWIRRGGFFPDYKLRLVRRDYARFEDRSVHEDIRIEGHFTPAYFKGALLHHAYPTLAGYIEHMNKYSSLGAEMAVAKKPRGFSFLNIIVRPHLTFFYNYFLRLGFLDGREGLLLHLYHAVYVSWKYAKAWELSRAQRGKS